MKKSEFKVQGYELVSSVAKAMGNAHRLELLELLANGPKSVIELAKEARMSVTNASGHLQILKRYNLVKTKRNVNRVHYRLADDSILKLITSLHKTAYSQLVELKHTISHFREQYGTDSATLRDMPAEDYILLDVRPQAEFEHGHRHGAINIPHLQINKYLDRFDRDKIIIAYCRGELCTLADEVVKKLNEAGFKAFRLHDIMMTKSA